ncbi:MAG: 3-isopropylmalate dehydratase small subunit [Rhodospirillaceae bacterium]|jgi:3-isopropylmalate/(R)-2-methylmalate dehydratase small subunit|nr:3-isopropylmalate dehydratase small subunit [Rhodospirillaceae bacterium]MBT5664641.1 3-isopropylmalate dehydratase small subunit [Rhodospirillaceae bacterium]MBT5808867.1 3-isopropylmalate dehydratase small subunit [Rhodospirillaceae bacterium]
MKAFKTFASTAIPIDIPNCDTDQIIPARFLRRAKGDPEYHRFMFHDLRFNADGSDKDFVFNKPVYSKAEILVADINWGCGSSRENAVDAMTANGIKSVIAPSFGDIHYSNCIQNGVLPIQLSGQDCATLRAQLRESPGAEIAIDLDAQSLTGPDQTTYDFDIKAFDKYRLLNGLDDVQLTQEFGAQIDAFETGYKAENSWAY